MRDKKVIVVSPHPDDLEIGMGGTVARMCEEGVGVISLVVTDGRGSTDLFSYGPQKLAEVRKKEVEESSRFLGVEELRLLGLSDVRSSDKKEILKESFLTLLKEKKPAEIYMPHPTVDKHPTHRIVSNSILEVLSSFGKSLNSVPSCWAYEVWTPFQGYDRIVDITKWSEKKAKAIRLHKSQIAYRDYAEGILGLNRYRAVFNEIRGTTKIKYGEVFLRVGY